MRATERPLLPARRYAQSELSRAIHEVPIPRQRRCRESAAMPRQYTARPPSNGPGRTTQWLHGTQPLLRLAVLPRTTPAAVAVEAAYGAISRPFVVLEHAVPEP